MRGGAALGTRVSGAVSQPLGLGQGLELLERVVLDLADPLARDVEGTANLPQRARPQAGVDVTFADGMVRSGNRAVPLADAAGEGGLSAEDAIDYEAPDLIAERGVK